MKNLPLKGMINGKLFSNAKNKSFIDLYIESYKLKKIKLILKLNLVKLETGYDFYSFTPEEMIIDGTVSDEESLQLSVFKYNGIYANLGFGFTC